MTGRGLVLALDIGGTEVRAGIVDRSGRLLARASKASEPDLTRFRASLSGLIQKVVASLPSPAELAAIGIGCKGVVDPAACRVRSLPGTFRFLEQQDLGVWARRAAGQNLPVAMDNDAKVALLGEQRWGAARARRHVVLLTLGSGVGGAILADGLLMRGCRDVAGHLGHLTIEFDGIPCSCGNRGCLEAYFSARAIEGEALAAIRRGCESRLSSDFAGREHALTCLDVFGAARGGDPLAERIVGRAATALAAAMAGIAHALDPEIFVLGGQIARAGRTLFDPLRVDLERRTLRLVGRRIPIRRAVFGASAGVVGAAAAAWNLVEGIGGAAGGPELRSGRKGH